MTLQLYAVDPPLLEQALAARGGSLFAVACPLADALRLQTELSARGEPDVQVLQDSARLTLHSGQPSFIDLTKESAYVAGFQVDAAPEGMIADPRIEVVTEGLLFTADAHRDEESGTTSIQLELTLCQFDHPFSEQRVALAAGLEPVTMQVPRGVTRSLNAHTELGVEEVLLFGGAALPADAQGRALVAFLRADAAPGQ